MVRVISLPSDPHLKASMALVFHAISLHSSDTAKAFATDLLPLVFLAMHAKPEDEGHSRAIAEPLLKDTPDIRTPLK